MFIAIDSNYITISVANWSWWNHNVAMPLVQVMSGCLGNFWCFSVFLYTYCRNSFIFFFYVFYISKSSQWTLAIRFHYMVCNWDMSINGIAGILVVSGAGKMSYQTAPLYCYITSGSVTRHVILTTVTPFLAVRLQFSLQHWWFQDTMLRQLHFC